MRDCPLVLSYSKQMACMETPWRNGSASDSRSEGCVFKSRPGQRFLNICKFEETNFPQATSTVSSTFQQIWAPRNSSRQRRYGGGKVVKCIGSSPALAPYFLQFPKTTENMFEDILSLTFSKSKVSPRNLRKRLSIKTWLGGAIGEEGRVFFLARSII